MPFQKGNKLGGRAKHEKLFHDMLMYAIQGTEGDKAELRKIAQALVRKAVDGDIAAIKEVADRLDGKVPQTHGGDPDAPLEVILRTVYEDRPNDAGN